MPESTKTYLFLTGADMDPTEVKRLHPTATFIARGYTEARAGAVSTTFSPYVTSPGVGDIWGILISVEEAAAGNARRYDVTTDDGRTFNAVAVGNRMVDGLATEVYAAAKYWELPTGYTGRLHMATPKLGKAGAGDDD